VLALQEIKETATGVLVGFGDYGQMIGMGLLGSYDCGLGLHWLTSCTRDVLALQEMKETATVVLVGFGDYGQMIGMGLLGSNDCGLGSHWLTSCTRDVLALQEMKETAAGVVMVCDYEQTVLSRLEDSCLVMLLQALADELHQGRAGPAETHGQQQMLAVTMNLILHGLSTALW
jgi:hypothetical protein